MGIMPAPVLPGNNCALCFLAGETPTLLKLFFGGIQYRHVFPGDPTSAPNGYYDAIQTEGDPCRWSGGDPFKLHWALTWHLNHSTIWLSFGVVETYFQGAVADNCITYWTNLLQDPGQHFFGGWAMIATPEQMQSWIEMVTPIVGPDPRMELFPMADGEIVLKFCNIQDGTNIKIKVNSALL